MWLDDGDTPPFTCWTPWALAELAAQPGGREQWRRRVDGARRVETWQVPRATFPPGVQQLA